LDNGRRPQHCWCHYIMLGARGRLRCLLQEGLTSVPAKYCWMPRGMWGVLPRLPGMVNPGA
jgi:hypothetical protein